MKNMKILLIGGGGTLGSYTSAQLLQMGFAVDVIAREHPGAIPQRLRYIQADADDAFLQAFLHTNRYQAIVDFLHYPDPVAYKARCRLLQENTDHLIFLSSYRVYADKEHPIQETSPLLLDMPYNDYLIKHDTYGISKCWEEQTVRSCGLSNWTIVRPLISFSQLRFDLVTLGSTAILLRSRQRKAILLPREAKDKVAGLGWAGNVGKMLARLVCNKRAYGETFTLGSGEVHSWEEIAGYYTQLLGSAVQWVDTEAYLENATGNTPADRIILLYDRVFNRTIDNTKVLAATDLVSSDFVSVKDALEAELNKAERTVDFSALSRSEWGRTIGVKMDTYIESHL